MAVPDGVTRVIGEVAVVADIEVCRGACGDVERVSTDDNGEVPGNVRISAVPDAIAIVVLELVDLDGDRGCGREGVVWADVLARDGVVHTIVVSAGIGIDNAKTDLSVIADVGEAWGATAGEPCLVRNHS